MPKQVERYFSLYCKSGRCVALWPLTSSFHSTVAAVDFGKTDLGLSGFFVSDTSQVKNQNKSESICKYK